MIKKNKTVVCLLALAMFMVGTLKPVSAETMTAHVNEYMNTGMRKVHIGDYKNLGIASKDTDILDDNGNIVGKLSKNDACEINAIDYTKCQYIIVSGNISGRVNMDDVLSGSIAEFKAVDILKENAKENHEKFSYDLNKYAVDDSNSSYDLTFKDTLSTAQPVMEKIQNSNISQIVNSTKPDKKVTDKSSDSLNSIKHNYKKEDEKLLASIIYCEVGSESFTSKLAVGSVVMNRVKSAKFPNSIKGVVYARHQFSPARNGRLAKALRKGVSDSCVKAAKMALRGDNNLKNYYYFDNRIHKSGYKKIGRTYFWKTPW